MKQITTQTVGLSLHAAFGQHRQLLIPSQRRNLEYWAAINQCPTQEETTVHTGSGPLAEFTRRDYKSCDNGTEVTILTRVPSFHTVVAHSI